MNKEKLFRYFFAAVFILLILQALHILSPFYTGIFGAVILSLIFWPLHKLSLHFIGRENPNAAAVVSTSLLFIAIVIPLTLTAWLLFKELREIYPVVERFANTLESWRQGASFSETSWLATIEMKLQAAAKLSGIDLQRVILEATNSVTETFIHAGRALPKNAFSLFVNLVVMATTLYFLFRDGPTLFKKLKDLTPMNEKHKDQIVHQLYLTVTAVVRGVLIVAFVQGSLAGIGFFIASVPSPILLGFLTFCCAIIPIVGAGIIWGSVFLYYLTGGFYLKAAFIFVWGFFVVSLVDNFLRPVLIGGKTKLPFLSLFLGLVGGMKVYGPMGLFFGPLIVALILAFVKIYREEYSHRVKQQDPQDSKEDPEETA